jgi:hypothetical protein
MELFDYSSGAVLGLTKTTYPERAETGRHFGCGNGAEGRSPGADARPPMPRTRSEGARALRWIPDLCYA